MWDSAYSHALLARIVKGMEMLLQACRSIGMEESFVPDDMLIGEMEKGRRAKC